MCILQANLDSTGSNCHCHGLVKITVGQSVTLWQYLQFFNEKHQFFAGRTMCPLWVTKISQRWSVWEVTCHRGALMIRPPKKQPCNNLTSMKCSPTNDHATIRPAQNVHRTNGLLCYFSPEALWPCNVLLLEHFECFTTVTLQPCNALLPWHFNSVMLSYCVTSTLP